jgi:hypothetical protein
VIHVDGARSESHRSTRRLLARVPFGYRAAAFFVLLALALYFPVAIGRIPFPADIVSAFPPWTAMAPPPPTRSHAELGDLVTQAYPWRTMVMRAVREGVMPLWNPAVLLGMPLQAQPQTAVFSPWTLLYLVLPIPIAWALLFPLRFALAGLFTAMFVRALGGSMLGSLASGVVFASCGFMTAWHGWSLVDSAVWLPLVFLAVDRLSRVPNARRAAAAAVVLPLPIFGGHPEVALYVLLAGATFAAYRLVSPAADIATAPGHRWRFIGWSAAAAVGALGIAAVQLLPTFEWIGEIVRTLDADWGHRAAREAVAFLSRDHLRNPNVLGVAIPEAAAYVGVPTVLIAPLALKHRRGVALLFVLMVAGAIEIAYGWPPAYELSRVLPVLRGLPNWRLILVADFGLAVLAGLGISALQRRVADSSSSLFASSWFVLAFGAWLAVAAGFTYALTLVNSLEHPALMLVFGPWAAGALLVTTGALTAAALTGVISGRSFAAAALALVLIDMASFSFGHVPFVKRDQLYAPSPTFTFLHQQAQSDYRVAPIDGTYGNNFEMMYGLLSATGYDFPLRRTAAFLAPLLASPGTSQFHAETVVAAPPALMNLANVKYLVATTYNDSAAVLGAQPQRFKPVFSSGSVRVFENVSVLPRAFFVAAAAVQIVDDERAQLARVQQADFDPAASVVLPARPQFPDHEAAVATPAAASTRIEEQTNHRLRLRVAAPGLGIVVISQAYYPGWHATVDAKPAPVLRADYAIQGVAVPAGTHDVDVWFEPRSFRVGLTISAVTAVLIATAVLVPRRRRPGDGR